MADDLLAAGAEPRASWTKLFSAFKVALDLKKLLLAAAGIVTMALGWWVFALALYSSEIPQWSQFASAENKQEAWSDFQRARKRWNLMHEMAGPVSPTVKVDAGDVATSLEDFLRLDEMLRDKAKSRDEIRAELPNADRVLTPASKPAGRMRSWPWYEDRGPNQYLLVEGVLRKEAEGHRTVPWERGEFLSWLISDQLPVLAEPLLKFLAPIFYFFNSDAGGFRIRLYLILVILWTLMTWGFFGGAICRIAAVQVARNEKISLRDAVAFSKEKCLNLFTAPLFPLVFLGILTFFLIIFGLIEGLIPIFGDIVLAGLLYPIVIVLGLIMAVVLVGLVGWPLMYPTIAAEGSDNFDALSRSYSYVFQAFWHYLAYWGLAFLYGAALIFFVGLMGSLVVYLGKWGMTQAPWVQSADPKSDRGQERLFVYAPTSFGWRDLLIKDSPHAKQVDAVTSKGKRVASYDFSKDYYDEMKWYNRLGAGLVWVWLTLFFLLVVGFGYSYFWTASTIIYFLMRQHVDDTEVSEVYFEEETLEPPPPSAPPTSPPAAKPNTVSLNVVDGSAAPAPAPAAVPPPPATPVATPTSTLPSAEPSAGPGNEPPPPAVPPV